MSISLKYDSFGNRIYKESTASSQTTKRKYIVDIVGKLPTILLELSPDDSYNAVKTYIYADGQILAQHEGGIAGDRYFYIHDRLGSIRLLVDTAGSMENKYSYTPFGRMMAGYTETIDNPFKFTGQWYDDEIGQYYLRARMYDPYLARFTSLDPVRGKFAEKF